MHFSIAPSIVIIIIITIFVSLSYLTDGDVIILLVDLSVALGLQSVGVDLVDHFLHELHGSLRLGGHHQQPSQGHQHSPHLDVAKLRRI